MAKNKYTIKYTETFVKQFNNILKYFIYKLQNKIAAENFYDEVIKEIEKRTLSFPLQGNAMFFFCTGNTVLFLM